VARPTPLSPWFVVMRLCEDNVAEEYVPEWWSDDDEDGGHWTPERTEARLYNSIHTAYRVASAGGAWAVVVADEEALKEYRPKGL